MKSGIGVCCGSGCFLYMIVGCNSCFSLVHVVVEFTEVMVKVMVVLVTVIGSSGGGD